MIRGSARVHCDSGYWPAEEGRTRFLSARAPFCATWRYARSAYFLLSPFGLLYENPRRKLGFSLLPLLASRPVAEYMISSLRTNITFSARQYWRCSTVTIVLWISACKDARTYLINHANLLVSNRISFKRVCPKFRVTASDVENDVSDRFPHIVSEIPRRASYIRRYGILSSLHS